MKMIPCWRCNSMGRTGEVCRCDEAGEPQPPTPSAGSTGSTAGAVVDEDKWCELCRHFFPFAIDDPCNLDLRPEFDEKGWHRKCDKFTKIEP